MSEGKNAFEYTYSAKDQAEIRSIREKYAPKEADKLAQLRALDEGVARKGTLVSLVVGVISCLLLGLGMCCCLVWGDTLFIPGILIGLIGIAGVTAAYPLYVRITEKERERVAPEILRLTDELMK